MTIASTINASHDAFVYPNSFEVFGGSARQFETFGQHQAKFIALLLIGLDHFQNINESFGYQIGDFLLTEIESRVRKNLSAHTFNRLGGAEFVVILPVGSPTDVTFLANEILEVIHRPFRVGEFKLGLVARIGVAIHHESQISIKKLLNRARIALSSARNARKDFFLYSPEQEDVEARKASLTSDLRHAINEDQLFLLYHPKIDLKTGRVAGVEALVRWQHPKLGIIAPDQFIPLAEETGMIAQLTHSVLHKVLRQCHAWNQAHMGLKIAANLSMWDLQDDKFPDQVSTLLANYRVLPSQLGLEITETAIMNNSSRVIDNLRLMKKMGVWISIDDFGTGHSSLAYLKNLPVNEIKIDRSFVRNMSEDNDNTIIVESVIELAHKFGLKVVAEGVENSKTKEMLDNLECDTAQGYYISKPISPTELKSWLSKKERFPARQIACAHAKKTWISKFFQLHTFLPICFS